MFFSEGKDPDITVIKVSFENVFIKTPLVMF